MVSPRRRKRREYDAGARQHALRRLAAAASSPRTIEVRGKPAAGAQTWRWPDVADEPVPEVEMRGGWTPTQDPDRTEPESAPRNPAWSNPVGSRSVGSGPVGSNPVDSGPASANPVGSDPLTGELRDDGLVRGDLANGGLVGVRPRDERDAAGGEVGFVDRLRGGRWWLVPKHLGVIAAVLVVGVLWAAGSVLFGRPEAIPVDRTPVGVTSGSPVSGPGGTLASPNDGRANPPSPRPTGATTSAPPSPQLVVHVAGKVRRPGLVRAATGARVADVLAAAGGALPGVDLTSVNLARQVRDGEQIVIGIPGAGQTDESTTPEPTSNSPMPGRPLDLNSATAAQLEGLPGVGPVLAQRIVEWRTQHGQFTAVDELLEVSGVGAKKFEALRLHVRV